ncbi:MAG TPA: MurR/RpiR family transcriptional regulator, partial [Pseudogracilibacillus sp.]|nr:MurR/RpiR family transcriptional regulator [Pseudogracilibacillus sp.]
PLRHLKEEYQLPDHEFLDKLITLKSNLPKRQKQVCDFVIENYQNISLLSIKELAKKCDVGQTTVLRFVNNAGYTSYNSFKKALHLYSVEKSQSTWWHLKHSLTTSNNDTIGNYWKEITHLLNNSLNEEFIVNFNRACHLLSTSETINIVGFRTSKASALYFGYMLSEFHKKIRQLSYGSDFIYDELLHLDKNDVIVMIALAPYTSLVLDVAEYCHSKKIPIILITDNLTCPIVPYADVVLKTSSSKKQYSIVPVIALIEAMVIEFGKLNSDTSIEHLNKLNKLLKDKNITTT